MKKILLGTASALVLGLVSTAAMAGGSGPFDYGYGKTSTDNTAVAVGVQLNQVDNDGSITLGSQGGEKSSKEWSYLGGKESSATTYQGNVTSANKIDGSFAHATGLFNVNQNNGNNVSQDAQNTVAAIINCDCTSGSGDFWGHDSGSTENTAVAVGLQASRVDNDGHILVDVANLGDKCGCYGQLNSISGGSFNNATGLMNVNQNNGNNVSQKAQNTVAAIIGKK